MLHHKDRAHVSFVVVVAFYFVDILIRICDFFGIYDGLLGSRSTLGFFIHTVQFCQKSIIVHFSVRLLSVGLYQVYN